MRFVTWAHARRTHHVAVVVSHCGHNQTHVTGAVLSLFQWQEHHAHTCSMVVHCRTAFPSGTATGQVQHGHSCSATLSYTHAVFIQHSPMKPRHQGEWPVRLCHKQIASAMRYMCSHIVDGLPCPLKRTCMATHVRPMFHSVHVCVHTHVCACACACAVFEQPAICCPCHVRTTSGLNQLDFNNMLVTQQERRSLSVTAL